MTRITQALRARLEEGKKNDQGFSLIELLVVVIIIGILAAIAIPVFIGVQNNAKDASAKSDLGNAKTAVVAYYAANPGGDVPEAADLGTYGYALTEGNTMTLDITSSTSFCLEATADSGNTFHVLADGGVEDGACP